MLTATNSKQTVPAPAKAMRANNACTGRLVGPAKKATLDEEFGSVS